MFESIQCSCQCYDSDQSCVCPHEEKILRLYTSGAPVRAMTPEEREWCIQEAVRAGEGSYEREGLEKLPDEELARQVLFAWNDYVQSNC